MSFGTVISYPIPLYQNLPIESDYYQPSRFVISDITNGQTTTVTTSTDHNYVVGQQIRLLIPSDYGAQELTGRQGTVISIPADDQVVINIDSTNYNSFIVSPYESVITNIIKGFPTVITTNNNFLTGQTIRVLEVSGMTEINNRTGRIVTASSTSISVRIYSTNFSNYTGGGIVVKNSHQTTQPQIIAIGDYNSGIISSTGRILPTTNIPGSFINISPN